MLMFLALLAAAMIFGQVKQRNLRADFPAPGQMVDVGGYKLHLHCQGTGSPTILLEAGQGESSLTWATLQPELAKSTRVCAYDRAGYGWSERSPLPRTVTSMVDELHTLLQRAEIAGPYLLVGHSVGGLNMRLFAQRYPQTVTGMVLLDPAHEAMLARLPADWQAYLLAQNRSARRMLQVMALLSATGLSAFAPALIQADARLPEAAQRTVQALQAMDDRYFATLAAELADSVMSLEQMHQAAVTDLGDIPLVVIEAGKAAAAAQPAALSPFTPVYNLHEELAAQSSQGKVVVAQQSDHYVHHDEPELVRNAIQDVLHRNYATSGG
jgi:pimeloyl-ACP methyl ester carboxylesterase